MGKTWRNGVVELTILAYGKDDPSKEALGPDYQTLSSFRCVISENQGLREQLREVAEPADAERGGSKGLIDKYPARTWKSVERAGEMA